MSKTSTELVSTVSTEYASPPAGTGKLAASLVASRAGSVLGATLSPDTVAT